MSPSHSRASPAPSIARIARRLSETELGRAVGSGTYRALASVAARLLRQVPSVTSVYLTGSATEPSRVRPGYSDVDLLIVVDLPTFESELVLRRRLSSALRALNAFGDLFKNLDCMTAPDLRVAAEHGSIWAIEQDRWVLLAGAEQRSTVRVAAEKLHIERAVSALRRWQSASAFQLDPSVSRPAALTRIGLHRTLSDVLAAWLGEDRLLPLEDLLTLAASRAASGTTLAALSASPRHAVERSDARLTEDFVAASLEALESLLSPLVATFDGAWSAFSPRRPSSLPSVARLGGLAISLGAAAVHHTFDRGGGFAVHAVTKDREPARLSVSRHVTLLGARATDSSLSSVPRPTLLTPTLFHAAALFDGAPFVGADLAVTAECVAGAAGPPPPRPGERQFSYLLAGRIAQLLWRPGGRTLRVTGDAGSRRRKLARDVRVLGPLLLAVAAGRPTDLSALVAGVPDGDQETLVRELRELQSAARRFLASSVG